MSSSDFEFSTFSPSPLVSVSFFVSASDVRNCDVENCLKVDEDFVNLEGVRLRVVTGIEEEVEGRREFLRKVLVSCLVDNICEFDFEFGDLIGVQIGV